MQRRIYCDTAAATPLAPEVLRAMKPWLERGFGNPSSLHQEGVLARVATETARKEVADFLSVQPDEIVFTGNGSEANSLALIGLAETLTPGLVIVSALEHSSVRNAALELGGRGWTVQIVKPTLDGVTNPEAIKKGLSQSKGDTIVSVTLASNEIGTVQPIKEIAKVIRQVRRLNPQRKIIFHTDACQVARFLDLNPAKLGVDALTFNAAKIYGPKGIGVLWLKRRLNPRPQIFGGGQENGRRSGTEAVPLVVGLAAACKLVRKNYAKENRLMALQKYFIEKVLKLIPDILINGTAERLPHIVNLQVTGVRAEQLVIELDAAGIATSAGSACSSRHRDSSYVILALSRQPAEAESAIRFSFGRDLQKRDIDYVVKRLNLVVRRLRSLPQF